MWKILTRSKPYRRAWLAISLCLLLVSASAQDHRVFVVKSIGTQLHGNVYFLNAVFDIRLPPYMLSAFEQGFDLPLAMEIEVFEHHRFWFDKNIVTIRQQYRIQYHTLLDTVSVLNVNAGSQHDYASLKEALASLTVILDYPLLDKNPLDPEQQYSARLRFGIDEAELPVPLKNSVLWAHNWNLVSDWAEWDITP